ncbi:MAG: hypothetical protein Q8R13_05030 [bacterium]|nr:hypothetical protein [bacterium]
MSADEGPPKDEDFWRANPGGVSAERLRTPQHAVVRPTKEGAEGDRLRTWIPALDQVEGGPSAGMTESTENSILRWVLHWQ